MMRRPAVIFRTEAAQAGFRYCAGFSAGFLFSEAPAAERATFQKGVCGMWSR